MNYGILAGVQEYKVVLTWEAIYDIIDIADYIELNFGKNIADRFQSNIKEQLEKLEYLGGVLSSTDIIYRGFNICKKIFSPSIIFYVIKEDVKEIHVLRVLREEKDWISILKQTQEYTYPYWISSS